MPWKIRCHNPLVVAWAVIGPVRAMVRLSNSKQIIIPPDTLANKTTAHAILQLRSSFQLPPPTDVTASKRSSCCRTSSASSRPATVFIRRGSFHSVASILNEMIIILPSPAPAPAPVRHTMGVHCRIVGRTAPSTPPLAPSARVPATAATRNTAKPPAPAQSAASSIHRTP